MKSTTAIFIALQGTITSIAATPVPEGNSVDILHCGGCWNPPSVKRSENAPVEARAVEAFVDNAIQRAVKRAVDHADSTNTVDVLHCGGCWNPPSKKRSENTGVADVEAAVDHAIQRAVKRAVDHADSTNTVDVLHCGGCWNPPSKKRSENTGGVGVAVADVETFVDHAVQRAVKRAVEHADSTNTVDVLHCGGCWNPPSKKVTKSLC